MGIMASRVLPANRCGKSLNNGRTNRGVEEIVLSGYLHHWLKVVKR